ncbi:MULTISPECIES: hypothetical protein [Rhodococcus]|uniref:hypothetical protein n=1 Tax=Rhodococcus TaxID=1827 RepID=UPI002953CE53|nr:MULTISPECIES: hypothetical protein [Rhodococcus]MDV7246597.1 hypothetical protein [Rhodococcus oxybenzonivorans]MDV7337609.1 hypothetical protein [Rhodococcus oxybenzonivorans]MDV8031381.1 hypothetical protein [Rhodococcus sp. IEGM 27]
MIAQIELLLDKMSVRPHVDIIADLALPLPVSVIGTMLGVPDDDRAAAASLVRDLVAPLEPSADAAAVARAAVAEDRLTDYFTGLLSANAERRATIYSAGWPPRARGRRVRRRRMRGTALLLFAAGFETTANLIGNGVAALLAHPEQMHLLRERPEIVGTAVEELLRYDAPVQTNGCTVLRPTTLASHDLTPGGPCSHSLVPPTATPTSSTTPTLSISPGPDAPHLPSEPKSISASAHRWPDSKEPKCFPRLLSRFRHLALAGNPGRRRGLSFRGLTSLPVSTR